MPEFPSWVVPMAATLTQDRFTAPGWIFERKLDGIRLLAYKQGTDVRLYSRTRHLQDVPSVARAIADMPVGDAIFDGELTWGSEDAGFHIFDLLWLDGRDLTSLAWTERRRHLEGFRFAPPLHRVEVLDTPEPWEMARREGWEGVIAKQVDAPYEQKRSRHWLKMKCEVRETFSIGGFTEPMGVRVGLGALLVGTIEGDDFVFAGKVGTGLDTRALLNLRRRLDSLEIDRSPFTEGKGFPRSGVHWVRPAVEVDVGFIERTVHGKLRHPRILAIAGAQ